MFALPVASKALEAWEFEEDELDEDREVVLVLAGWAGLAALTFEIFGSRKSCGAN